MSGPGLSGIAATQQYVIVTDKSADGKEDIFHCLRAEDGQQLWVLRYAAAGEMDFTNAPRANPVIYKGRVYLLGAFGHLHCVELTSGRVLWQREFGAELPSWGVSSSPLIAESKLIVNPGALQASVVALDPSNGKVIWKSLGERPAYAPFIVGEFGGVQQIVGYDAVSLGGWDIASGRRLWRLVPPEEGDFNVPTPIRVDGKILVATENNGTRLYGFDDQGRIQREPLAWNRKLRPYASSPVAINDLVFGCCYDGLFCLDLRDGLRTRYGVDAEPFGDYAALIGGNDRVLIITVGGELILIEARADRYRQLSRVRLFGPNEEVWSHPALVGNRLYIRSTKQICCVLPDEETAGDRQQVREQNLQGSAARHQSVCSGT